MRKTLLCLVVIVALGLVLTPMLSSAGPPPGEPPCDKAGPGAHNPNCQDPSQRCEKQAPGQAKKENGKTKKGCPEGDGDGDGATGTCTNADLAILGTITGTGPNLICLYGPGNTADPSAEGECPGGTVLGETGGAIALLCSTS